MAEPAAQLKVTKLMNPCPSCPVKYNKVMKMNKVLLNPEFVLLQQTDLIRVFFLFFFFLHSKDKVLSLSLQFYIIFLQFVSLHFQKECSSYRTLQNLFPHFVQCCNLEEKNIELSSQVANNIEVSEKNSLICTVIYVVA